jgi:hypothetical protein
MKNMWLYFVMTELFFIGIYLLFEKLEFKEGAKDIALFYIVGCITEWQIQKDQKSLDKS